MKKSKFHCLVLMTKYISKAMYIADLLLVTRISYKNSYLNNYLNKLLCQAYCFDFQSN